jgi:hypothetical protein
MHVVVCGALVKNSAVLLVHRSPTRRAYPDLRMVRISDLDGLPLVFGALPALLRSLSEFDRLPRRDEARTTASPSGP